jgi:putative toxin-antitoxin system antitoxin component (TIGR02293 family)
MSPMEHTAPTLEAVSLALDPYVRVFQAPPHERIRAIREGIPATAVAELSAAMGRTQEEIMTTIGLSRTTVHRKAQKAEVLSPNESERVLGLQALIGQVCQMVPAQALHDGFDPARWLGSWLARPQPALGAEKPAAYMDTVEGQKLVSNLLMMAQSGAFA